LVAAVHVALAGHQHVSRELGGQQGEKRTNG
jgi:hypothetical protein